MATGPSQRQFRNEWSPLVRLSIAEHPSLRGVQPPLVQAQAIQDALARGKGWIWLEVTDEYYSNLKGR
jgi:hypothetical protein